MFIYWYTLAFRHIQYCIFSREHIRFSQSNDIQNYFLWRISRYLNITTLSSENMRSPIKWLISRIYLMGAWYWGNPHSHPMVAGIVYTVYPKKYAHGFCFAVLCCGYTLTDFPISIKLTSLALWQSNDCPSASKATLMNMDKYFMWIHYERLHNHNKAKHNKTVCIFLEMYCIVSRDGVCYIQYRSSFSNDEIYLETIVKYRHWYTQINTKLWYFQFEITPNINQDTGQVTS